MTVPPDPAGRAATPAASALFLRDSEVQQGIERLFFANLHLWASIDGALAQAGLGRAHFRALYFITRCPGLSVGELLRLLGISKQALSRVVKLMERQALIAVRPGGTDRRQRLLTPTEAGREMEARLSARLRARMASAYSAAGQDAVTGYWQVADALVPPGERGALAAIMAAHRDGV